MEIADFLKLPLPNKVLIIGDPASGKTYLSSLIKTHPIVHTDDYIKYGFKDALYKLQEDLQRYSKVLVEGVQGYRLLRKGEFVPDMVVEVRRPIEEIELEYKKRKGDFQSVLGMIKANQTVLSQYSPAIRPQWIIVENSK